MDEYPSHNPTAPANHIVHHYGFNETTAKLFRDAFAEIQLHKLSSGSQSEAHRLKRR